MASGKLLEVSGLLPHVRSEHHNNPSPRGDCQGSIVRFSHVLGRAWHAEVTLINTGHSGHRDRCCCFDCLQAGPLPRTGPLSTCLLLLTPSFLSLLLCLSIRHRNSPQTPNTAGIFKWKFAFPPCGSVIPRPRGASVKRFGVNTHTHSWTATVTMSHECASVSLHCTPQPCFKSGHVGRGDPLPSPGGGLCPPEQALPLSGEQGDRPAAPSAPRWGRAGWWAGPAVKAVAHPSGLTLAHT